MIITNIFDKNEKYLLACSGGVDSIALFHLLIEKNIKFDVITINYNFREQSKEEVKNIKELCIKNNKKLYLHENKQKIKTNMEKEARDIRYNFFDKTMKENNYKGLITGHNLNDRVEWFLMQLTKGAGLKELLGMEKISYRNEYQILKPLIETEREEIEKYIQEKKIKSFYDESNSDISYHPSKNPQGIKRNYFRHKFAKELTKEFKKGIVKSFSILEKESKELIDYKIKKIDEITIIDLKTVNDINIVKAIDEAMKKHYKYLMSSKQREEILNQKSKGIVIDKKAIGFIRKNKILITPYKEKSQSFSELTKEEKEYFRKNKIPAKNRIYLKKENINLNSIISV